MPRKKAATRKTPVKPKVNKKEQRRYIAGRVTSYGWGCRCIETNGDAANSLDQVIEDLDDSYDIVFELVPVLERLCDPPPTKPITDPEQFFKEQGFK